MIDGVMELFQASEIVLVMPAPELKCAVVSWENEGKSQLYTRLKLLTLKHVGVTLAL